MWCVCVWGEGWGSHTGYMLNVDGKSCDGMCVCVCVCVCVWVCVCVGVGVGVCGVVG